MTPRRALHTALTALLTGLLCLAGQGQAMADRAASAPTPSRPRQTTSPARPTRAVRVEPGQTPSALARRYGLDVEALMRANGLASERDLKAGMTLVLPAPEHMPAAKAAPAGSRSGATQRSPGAAPAAPVAAAARPVPTPSGATAAPAARAEPGPSATPSARLARPSPGASGSKDAAPASVHTARKAQAPHGPARSASPTPDPAPPAAPDAQTARTAAATVKGRGKVQATTVYASRQKAAETSITDIAVNRDMTVSPQHKDPGATIMSDAGTDKEEFGGRSLGLRTTVKTGKTTRLVGVAGYTVNTAFSRDAASPYKVNAEASLGGLGYGLGIRHDF